ncbi:Pol polyprotein [Plakobranchus ocellatus]|uniref:Pol polyprotein n=1 Tax=Plakobranchus ocellatus TaxID=259542 RepID=A0AAV4A5T0_9GAST|nr:Pol polyprotein [Plakobranchus ocellatus]
MSVAHDSINRAHLGIRRTKDKVLSNFYWPGVDGDVTRYCRSCDLVRNWRRSAASVTIIEDLEGEHFNDSDCEALPEFGGWGREETVNDLKYGDELTLDQRRQLEEVALIYSSIFSNRPGTVSTEEHCIELTSTIPVRQRPYPVPYALRQTLRDELREMEDLGVFRKSSSPYASPVIVVKKKNGTNRVCIDYRQLNKLTIFDPQPMTPPADIFQGHSLGRGAIGLQDENVEKVRNAPRPKTKREVRAFLGLVGYYKEFVPNFAAISAPLSDLVHKGKPVLQLPYVNKSSTSERMHLIKD